MQNQSRARGRRRSLRRTVLVVEPNPGYRSAMEVAVTGAGAEFESVAEIGDVKPRPGGAKKYDMVIVGGSDESPLTPEEVRRVRATVKSPLIALVESYDETKETLDVYRAGADQVLPKPFVPDALIGAIGAGMRLPGPVSVVPLATRIEVGSLTFDSERREVTGAEGSVRMTKREWQVLAFLLSSPNRFFTATEITLEAWGPDASVEQFRAYIAAIRKKLSRFSKYCRVVTQKAKGYCLAVEHTG